MRTRRFAGCGHLLLCRLFEFDADEAWMGYLLVTLVRFQRRGGQPHLIAVKRIERMVLPGATHTPLRSSTGG